MVSSNNPHASASNNELPAAFNTQNNQHIAATYPTTNVVQPYVLGTTASIVANMTEPQLLNFVTLVLSTATQHTVSSQHAAAASRRRTTQAGTQNNTRKPKRKHATEWDIPSDGPQPKRQLATTQAVQYAGAGAFNPDLFIAQQPDSSTRRQVGQVHGSQVEHVEEYPQGQVLALLASMSKAMNARHARQKTATATSLSEFPPSTNLTVAASGARGMIPPMAGSSGNEHIFPSTTSASIIPDGTNLGHGGTINTSAFGDTQLNRPNGMFFRDVGVALSDDFVMSQGVNARGMESTGHPNLQNNGITTDSAQISNGEWIDQVDPSFFEDPFPDICFLADSVEFGDAQFATDFSNYNGVLGDSTQDGNGWYTADRGRDEEDVEDE